MEQIPSWEAHRLSASQEIPRILWNLKVHYRLQKGPDLSQINLVRAPVPILEDHFNIILSSTPGSSKWSSSCRSPHQNPVCTSPLPHTCHIPRIRHSSWFDHPIIIIIIIIIISTRTLICDAEIALQVMETTWNQG